MGLFWGNFGFMLSTYFLPFFFFPGGCGTDLSDVCFFQYIHRFEVIGGVLQYCYDSSVIFVARGFNVFGGD